tara:strand:+ start:207 stop:566 length:360 start_codon:yes stop_codon:yes gene_type:complete
MKTKVDSVTKLLIALAVLTLSYMTYDHFNVKHKFESDQVEKSKTTGLIIEFNGGSKNAPDFEFEFEVEGEKYEGRHLIVTKLGTKTGSELREYIGRKYQVWYVVDDPTYNKLLLDKPVR